MHEIPPESLRICGDGDHEADLRIAEPVTDEDHFADAVSALACLISSRSPGKGVPEAFRENQDYLFLYKALSEIREAAMATAAGDLSYPITMKGFVPGALKTLQASLRHLTWQTQAIASGDFSQRVDFMGDFSQSFNSMVRQLEESVRKLKASEQTLWLAARTDQLTGMKNRTWFFELFETSMEQDIAVIMFDIDRFKAVNDTYGHAAGDEALRAVAAAVSSLGLRGKDYCGRLGGEEFAIVLHDSEIDAASLIGERLRACVEGLCIRHAGREFGLTVSLGLAVRKPGEEAETLLGRADRAMYRAKSSGRNRVCGE